MTLLEQMYSDIPVGSENAITKQKLQEKWQMNERAVRRIISVLREYDNGDGYVIISSSATKGFYKTDNAAEIARYKKETMSRAKSTFCPMRKINRILAEHEAADQMEMVAPNNLKAARAEAGLKAVDVVKAVQEKADPTFTKMTMSVIENGKALPTAAQLGVFCMLYKKTATELIGLEFMQLEE